MELLTPPHIEIRSPQRFNFPFVVLVNVFSGVFGVAVLFVCCLPLIFLVLAASIMDFAHQGAEVVSLVSTTLLITMWISLAIAFLMMGLFLPVGMSNPLVKTLCAPLRIEDSTLPQYCVQIKFEPREHRGIRAFLEDADDVGILRFERDSLAFQGDAVSFAVPYSTITDLRRVSTGLRGYYLLGKYIQFDATTIGPYKWIAIGERESNLLTTSHKLSRAIFHTLSERVNSALNDVPQNPRSP
ncbi:MAG: hypothetical protein IT577_24660 [Verrucomicrobiae bacterium]|nr:hypothetical protein [Verrucomicrobiae bacterium]